MSIILTKPANPNGSQYHDGRKVYQIPINGSQIIGSVNMNKYIAVKWLVSVRDITDNQTMLYEVLATHNDSIPTHNISNVIGSLLPIVNVVDTMGSYLTLEVTNNHQELIEVRIQNLTMQR